MLPGKIATLRHVSVRDSSLGKCVTLVHVYRPHTRNILTWFYYDALDRTDDTEYRDGTQCNLNCEHSLSCIQKVYSMLGIDIPV